MKQFIVYLFILWTVTEFGNAIYHDCGSTLGTVESVEVSNCKPDDARCVLVRNANTTIKLKFTLKENVDKIKAIVHGVIMSVPINFPIPNSDACVDSNLVCPLKAGETYLYVAVMPVLKSYPKITVEVKWELQRITTNISEDKNKTSEDTSNDILCIMIPSRIQ
ncbi:hypothetical protein RN001_002771 [Aquatica leii]|uniref:MD-2-related lipid-recognition domain-containing protein n=1 Tax=Aquatica leii TaxID=1421715 RepID=A0AAN7SSW6_9COLE|nr:hypothetical protein RN001_002771 [Aquatica leii]